MSDDKNSKMDRRLFLKLIGAGASAWALSGCESARDGAGDGPDAAADRSGSMTYRTHPQRGDRVSLLGYGCMRLPTVSRGSARESADEIDQAAVNAQVDVAIAHGVNYFDTSPAYCRGLSERAMGIALSRHPRDKYFIATKLSNFDHATWSREASLAMYHKSFKELQVEHIDYMLLHGVGMGGMASLKGRYLDNGVLDFLLEERAAGRIRNLGFSYHGDISVFDYLLEHHRQYGWDFAQIQLNYVDWRHAKEVNARNTNAEYLYGELNRRKIPAIVMEPLLGGRLASLNFRSIEQLKRLDPEASIASWAFRFAGTPGGILTVLSGMTYMEHLRENLHTYSPLKPLSEDELAALEEVAKTILEFPLIQCNTCQYCMPCPYGLDIPNIFSHYNKCLNEGNYSENINDENYRRARRAFLVGYDRSVPKLRQANRCIGCNKCVSHCPQRIDIPAEMQRIDRYVEVLRRGA